MNLLLLEPHELGADRVASLGGRRASHAWSVLRLAPGDLVRIGVVGGPLGRGEVRSCDPQTLVLHCELEAAAEPRPRDVLLLAVPRPKALARCLEDAAALGFGKIVLLRCWRVDKSWLLSHALAAAHVRERLLLGLEQARRTHVPEVELVPLFRPFVEDRLDGVATPANRFVAHLENACPVDAVSLLPEEPCTLAIGPDGGFLPFEVELLAKRGFAAITLGPHPQRVPVALAALWAQLALVRAREQ